MVDNIVDKFSALGISEYEAKAYLALIRNNPATAYEVAKLSSVPTSKIYSVIEKLKEKSMVIEIHDEDKKKYVPAEYSEVLSAFKSKMDTLVCEIEIECSKIKKDKNYSYIWNINDYEYLIEKSKRMIEETSDTLLLSIWPTEFKLFEDVLLDADKRGVKLSAVHFGKTSFPKGAVFEHPIEDTIYNEKGGRGLVIICDATEVLIANIGHDNKVEGASSKSRGFVTLAEDYIKHDVYIMKLVRRFDDFLIKNYGENYYKLRDIFSDEVIE
jgi:sugar-specific transcriptional regulator TrmB